MPFCLERESPLGAGEMVTVGDLGKENVRKPAVWKPHCIGGHSSIRETMHTFVEDTLDEQLVSDSESNKCFL